MQVVGSDLVYNETTARLLTSVLRQVCECGAECHLVLQDHARIHFDQFVEDVSRELCMSIVTEEDFPCDLRNTNLFIFKVRAK